KVPKESAVLKVLRVNVVPRDPRVRRGPKGARESVDLRERKDVMVVMVIMVNVVLRDPKESVVLKDPKVRRDMMERTASVVLKERTASASKNSLCSSSVTTRSRRVSPL